MSKLPIKKPGHAVSKNAMTERLAAMRKDAGVEEKCTLPFLCSVTGKPFAVAFKRASASERYRIERIDPGAPGAGGLLGRLFGGLAPTPTAFAVKDFDFYSFACPHCGHAGSPGIGEYFRCGCGVLHCGGTIRKAGGCTLATCHPACGDVGPLTSALKSFSGTQGAAEPGRKAITGQPATKRLTGPSK